MAIDWSGFQTQHPLTKAWRSLTPDLLAEAFLAPKLAEPDWDAALTRPDAPWAASYAAIPDQVRPAVETAFRNLLAATQTANLSDVDLANLPQSRVRNHVEALKNLGSDLCAMPSDLATSRHILNGASSLEPFPMCPPPPDGFATTLENAIHTKLLADFGSAPAKPTPKALAKPGTALRHIQDNLTRAAAPVAQDHTTRFLTIRDSATEAELAAAMVRRLIEEGVSPKDISLLVPDASYPAVFFQAAFEMNGIPISGQTDAVVRDLETEILWLLVQAAQPAPPPMVFASLCISPLMPWSASEGHKMARSIIQYGSSNAPECLKGVAGSLPTTNRSLLARVSDFFDAAPSLRDAQKRLAALCNAKRETEFTCPLRKAHRSSF